MEVALWHSISDVQVGILHKPTYRGNIHTNHDFPDSELRYDEGVVSSRSHPKNRLDWSRSSGCLQYGFFGGYHVCRKSIRLE
jgi:hypothetical protein